MSESTSRIYLDHAAITAVRPAAMEAFAEAVMTLGNPSSVHSSGRQVRRLLDDAREEVAALLTAEPIEVVFTGSGTEAANLAIHGHGGARPGGAIVVSPTEHHCVLDPVAHRAAEGLNPQVTLPVDRYGLVTIDDVREHLENARSETGTAPALLTTMAANNETGAEQPITELSELAAATGVPYHVDATASVGHRSWSFASLPGVTTLCAAGQKFGAPTGTGLLLVRRTAQLAPLQQGGSHERGLRPGTENVAGAVALAVALREAVAEASDEEARLIALRRELVERLRATGEAAGVDIVLNTPLDQSSPNILNVSFPGCLGETLLMLLDRQGIDVSAGSACTAGVTGGSHVLLAAGVAPELSRAALRFSFGHTTTQSDIERLDAALAAVLPQAVSAGAFL